MKKTFTMKSSKKSDFHNDPIDQATLDLHFVEAFIDLLGGISRGTGELDEVKASTIASMCFECGFKIKRVKKFLENVPIGTVKAA